MGFRWESNPPKCFFITVQDRSAATLIPLIKKWILPGTRILSDCWKAYSSLVEEGYDHEMVSHSIEFVSDTGIHTNNIESRWNAVKKLLPRYGMRKALYDSYFKEYCVRRKYLNVAADPFAEFLQLIVKVYRPPSKAAAAASADSLGLLLPAPADRATAAGGETGLLSPADVGNFNLLLDITLSDNDTDANESMQDMFQ